MRNYIRHNAFRVPLTTVPGEFRVAYVSVPPAEACQWRVTLASLVPFGIEGFTAPQWGPLGPKALVRWGHEGGFFFAAIDWNPLGCTFAVNGYDVQVDVRTLSGMVFPAGVQPVAYASIVPGRARDNAKAPVFSTRLTFGGAGSIVHDLPPFARRVRWWNRDAAVAVNLGVRFLDDAAAASVRYAGGAADFHCNPYEPAVAVPQRSLMPVSALDIPSYAAFAEFTAAAAVTLQVEYELDLG